MKYHKLLLIALSVLGFSSCSHFVCTQKYQDISLHDTVLVIPPSIHVWYHDRDKNTGESASIEQKAFESEYRLGAYGRIQKTFVWWCYYNIVTLDSSKQNLIDHYGKKLTLGMDSAKDITATPAYLKQMVNTLSDHKAQYYLFMDVDEHYYYNNICLVTMHAYLVDRQSATLPYYCSYHYGHIWDIHPRYRKVLRGLHRYLKEDLMIPYPKLAFVHP